MRTSLAIPRCHSVIKSALASPGLISSTLVQYMRFLERMKILTWLRQGVIISVIYTIGLVELYYLPRYGLEYLLGAIGLTVFMAGFWLRTHWEY